MGVQQETFGLFVQAVVLLLLTSQTGTASINAIYPISQKVNDTVIQGNTAFGTVLALAADGLSALGSCWCPTILS